MNQLIAPPIGALLFTIGMALPFATNAVCFALGAVLVGRVVLDTFGATAKPSSRSAEVPAGTAEVVQLEATVGAPTGTGIATELEGPRGSWRSDIVEGWRWLMRHPPMRTLALTIFAFNVTFGAAWGVLVLYSQERLGMAAVGFGLITTATAVGGIIGTSAYGSLERRFSLADIMRVGLVIETFTHLILALTTSPIVALATMVVFGGHAFVWNTTSTVVRQRAVPDELLGRVTGVYLVAVFLGIVIGTPIGGLLASAFGITAPFWFGFVGSAILVILLWRRFDDIVHSSEVPTEPAAASAS